MSIVKAVFLATLLAAVAAPAYGQLDLTGIVIQLLAGNLNLNDIINQTIINDILNDCALQVNVNGNVTDLKRAVFQCEGPMADSVTCLLRCFYIKINVIINTGRLNPLLCDIVRNVSPVIYNNSQLAQCCANPISSTGSQSSCFINLSFVKCPCLLLQAILKILNIKLPLF